MAYLMKKKKRIEFSIQKTNERSIRFSESLGFKRMGESEKGYKYSMEFE
jgi:RimJ/RimL family protein N-acetyltransferase